jgi:hypothetical protein
MIVIYGVMMVNKKEDPVCHQDIHHKRPFSHLFIMIRPAMNGSELV